ncbi:N-acetylglucosamine/diacetylchitobiose ABC transporter substrate-binding protein [Kribbella sp. GL6]|uniref:N-acetylglucosamine/diacetylchitobiose ABC transporter substrate-binding protein n=1 Tax=Kribbella sp. GL6 TaxID=3419765 RepID=UPI003D0419B5
MSLSRRHLLGVSLGALAAPLAGCATTIGNDPKTQSSPGASVAVGNDPANPFGVANGSKVEAVIFNGGFGTEYAENAAAKMRSAAYKAQVNLRPVVDLQADLQSRFVAGSPPDVFDNSGAKAIPKSAIAAQAADLTSVLDAPGVDGTRLRETVVPAVLDAGLYDGRLIALNYSLTLYGWWYSASMFSERGITPPTTWDEMLKLGEQAKKSGKYLFVFGKEAASYYLWPIYGTAFKMGGDEVRKNLDNLKPDCWRQEPLVAAVNQIGECIKRGYVKPGGAGTQFTQAQTQWSLQQESLFYYSGSWIENEQKKQTKAGFEMTMLPDLTLPGTPKVNPRAALSTASESFMVPEKAANGAGGREFIRQLLSKEVAAKFATLTNSLSVVKGATPDRAKSSAGLKSQVAILADSPEGTTMPKYGQYYQIDELPIMTAFLSGKLNAAQFVDAMQKEFDRVAKDSSIKKVPL